MASPSEPATRQVAQRPVLAHKLAGGQRLPLWPQHSIRARLQLSHLLTSLLPLLLIGTALLFSTARAERRIVERTQTSVATSLSRDIADYMGTAASELLAFGRQVPLSSSNQAAIQNATRDFVNRHYPDVVELEVLDLTGQQVARSNHERTYFDDELINRIEEPFFASAAQGVIHPDITEALNGKRVLQLAVPVRNGISQVTGVVVAQYSTQHIAQSLAMVPPDTGRSAFVIDNTGKVLLGNPPESLIGTQDLRRWARTTNTVATLRDSNGKQTAAARATIQRGPWSVVVEQPTDIAFFTSRRNVYLLALVLILTAIGVAIWSVILARELTRPIVQLRDGVQTLGAGLLGGTIDVARDDELGQLANEFNSMSERLAESQRAIEQRNARLSEGLNLARVIQRDLLPQGGSPLGAVQAQAICEPAAEIGGDFYTYVPLPDGRLRLVVGDASGKGVAAALVMALTSSLVEVEGRAAASPAALLTRLNGELFPRFSTSHMCIGLLVAEFDPTRRRVTVANAGMVAPMVAASGSCFYLPSYGPPLGVVANATYADASFDLLPEQTLVLISDGIVEARDAANNMWGFNNFEATVSDAAGGGPQGIVNDVLHRLKAHIADTPMADDMTIIAATLVAHPQEQDAYELVPSTDHARHDQPAATR